MASLRGFRQRDHGIAPGYRRAKRVRDGKTRAQAILVEAVAGPGAAEPCAVLALDKIEPLLRGERRGVELRMIAAELGEGQLRRRCGRRVQADEQRATRIDALQL